MTPRLAAPAPTRNPVARSLALAVLSLALVVAVLMGAMVFAALLAVFVVGYAVSFVHAWWRMGRIRRRAAFVADAKPAEATAPVIAEIIEVTGDTTPRGTGGPA